MYVCVYSCIYTYVHTCTACGSRYVCVPHFVFLVCLYIHAFTYTCIHTKYQNQFFMYKKCGFMAEFWSHTYMHTHIHTGIYIHSLIHAYIHAYMHAYIQGKADSLGAWSEEKRVPMVHLGDRIYIGQAKVIVMMITRIC